MGYEGEFHTWYQTRIKHDIIRKGGDVVSRFAPFPTMRKFPGAILLPDLSLGNFHTLNRTHRR